MAASQTLQDRLDAHLEKSKASRTPEVNAVLAATAEHLRAEGAIERALGVGATAPDFTLPNALGARVSLTSLLEQGPVILAWYRGGW